MCHDCYWRQKIYNKAELLSGSFTRELKWHFLKFAADPKITNPKRFFRTLDKYCDFFQTAEPFWGKLTAADQVLDQFCAEDLRRSAIPYDYMVRENLLTAISIDDIERHAAMRQQHEILIVNAGEWYVGILEEYNLYLQELAERYFVRGWRDHNARYSQRTIIGNLRAARHFLKSIIPPKGDRHNTLRKLNETDFNTFFCEGTGHNASLLAFGRFIKRKKKRFTKLDITLRQSPSKLKILSADECTKLIQSWLSPRNNSKYGLIGLLLIIYAQKIKNIIKLKVTDLKFQDGGYSILLGSAPIDLPPVMTPVISAYLKQRNTRKYQSEYLFPGRVSNRHLSATAVTVELSKKNIDEPMLFATSMIRSFTAGDITNPKIIVRATGVSMATAIKYFNQSTNAGRRGGPVIPGYENFFED